MGEARAQQPLRPGSEAGSFWPCTAAVAPMSVTVASSLHLSSCPCVLSSVHVCLVRMLVPGLGGDPGRSHVEILRLINISQDLLKVSAAGCRVANADVPLRWPPFSPLRTAMPAAVSVFLRVKGPPFTGDGRREDRRHLWAWEGLNDPRETLCAWLATACGSEGGPCALGAGDCWLSVALG